MPSLPGNSLFGANLNKINNTPHRHLRDFVTPVDELGRPNPGGHFIRPGASTIYREQGNRLIAVKFSVRNRDLASAVAEAQEKTNDLFEAPYRAEWSKKLFYKRAGSRFYEMEPFDIRDVISRGRYPKIQVETSWTSYKKYRIQRYGSVASAGRIESWSVGKSDQYDCREARGTEDAF